MSTAGEEAAQWLCELREGGADTRTAFVAWLKDSPRNLREFLLASAAVKAFDGVGPQDEAGIQRLLAEALGNREGNVVRLKEDTAPFHAYRADIRTHRTWRRVAGIAAAVLLAAGGWWTLPYWTGAKSYVTDLGEQRALRLEDGSFVHLNTQSRVKVHFSTHERRLELVEGEALFIVAQDRARPFRVYSGDSVIQAIGTQFNVYRQAAGTKVSVIEGAVRVSGAAAPVSAGEEVKIERGGQVVKDKPVDVSEAIAWREQRLIFRAERLEDIAAEFNRYNPVRIRVEGEAARDRRLTGTGTATSPESLVQFLAQYEDLRVEQHGQEIVIRSAGLNRSAPP